MREVLSLALSLKVFAVNTCATNFNIKIISVVVLRKLKGIS